MFFGRESIVLTAMINAKDMHPTFLTPSTYSSLSDNQEIAVYDPITLTQHTEGPACVGLGIANMKITTEHKVRIPAPESNRKLLLLPKTG